MPTAPMSGRRAQAARNDELIMNAAREVFVADPTAPIAAVAERAGVEGLERPRVFALEWGEPDLAGAVRAA